MRVVYGRSEVGSRKSDGQGLGRAEREQPSSEAESAKPVRSVTHINGHRIHFAELARFAWPTKTEANLAFVARVDARTARRWLAGDTEPPAGALGIILAEIMKRFHQRD